MAAYDRKRTHPSTQVFGSVFTGDKIVIMEMELDMEVYIMPLEIGYSPRRKRLGE